LGEYGYGAVCGQSWFFVFGEWNAEWISENMTLKELYPIQNSKQIHMFQL
jgi:hypothetical protein